MYYTLARYHISCCSWNFFRIFLHATSDLIGHDDNAMIVVKFDFLLCVD